MGWIWWALILASLQYTVYATTICRICLDFGGGFQTFTPTPSPPKKNIGILRTIYIDLPSLTGSTEWRSPQPSALPFQEVLEDASDTWASQKQVSIWRQKRTKAGAPMNRNTMEAVRHMKLDLFESIFPCVFMYSWCWCVVIEFRESGDSRNYWKTSRQFGISVLSFAVRIACWECQSHFIEGIWVHVCWIVLRGRSFFVMSDYQTICRLVSTLGYFALECK